MKSSPLEVKAGVLLYLSIFIFAVILRINHLGAFPLTDEEGLSALVAAQGTPHASLFYVEPSNVLRQPSYEFLTGVVFRIFGADDFFARVVPALAGSALVLTPLLARVKLGWGRVTLMGCLLGFCPVFVTISRTASGASLSVLGAMTFIMGGLGRETEDKGKILILIGAGLGLCLASGPYFIIAILSLALSLLIWRLFGLDSGDGTRIGLIPRTDASWIIGGAAVAVLVFASGLGSYLDGISGLFESVAFWLRGWSSGGPFKSITLLTIVPTYMPTLFLLGIMGGWTSVRKGYKLGLFSVILVVVGLIVVMVFPGRQPMDLIWIALPLSFLGSSYLTSFAVNFFEGRINLWVIAIASLIILFAFMAYLQIASLVNQESVINPVIVGMTLLGFLALVLVILSFFGLGWEWALARLSLILASILLVILLSISALWRLNFRSNMLKTTELWRETVPYAGLGIMMDTLKTTSQIATGTDYGLEVELEDNAPYALVWALRNFQPYTGSIDDNTGSPVVLASHSEIDLALQDDYIGQTIVIGEQWDWDSALPPEFLKWWVKRQPPILQDEWLILVRQDIAFFD